MSPKEQILLSISIVILFSLLFLILFGNNGWVDLNHLKKEKSYWIEKNNQLTHRNLSLYREINRLKNDPELIKNVARQELGMIGENELILKIKTTNPNKRKLR